MKTTTPASCSKSMCVCVQVNDGGTHVRRHPDNPVPDIFSIDERKKIKEKTVYVVGHDIWSARRGK